MLHAAPERKLRRATCPKCGREAATIIYAGMTYMRCSLCQHISGPYLTETRKRHEPERPEIEP